MDTIYFNFYTLALGYSAPVLNVLSLILGIIVICRKDVPTKLIGIWLAASSAANVIAYAIRVFGNMFGTDTFARLSTVSTISSTVLGTVSVICLFLYAKIRYGAKGLIAIILLRLAEAPLVFAFNGLWGITSHGVSGSEGLQFNYLLTGIKELLALIIYIIILAADFKHRKSETHLKIMWFTPFYLVLCSLALIGLCVYTSLSLASISMDELATNAYSLISYAINYLPIYAAPVASIYVLAKGRRIFENRKKAA